MNYNSYNNKPIKKFHSTCNARKLENKQQKLEYENWIEKPEITDKYIYAQNINIKNKFKEKGDADLAYWSCMLLLWNVEDMKNLEDGSVDLVFGCWEKAEAHFRDV